MSETRVVTKLNEYTEVLENEARNWHEKGNEYPQQFIDDKTRYGIEFEFTYGPHGETLYDQNRTAFENDGGKIFDEGNFGPWYRGNRALEHNCPILTGPEGLDDIRAAMAYYNSFPLVHIHTKGDGYNSKGETPDDGGHTSLTYCPGREITKEHTFALGLLRAHSYDILKELPGVLGRGERVGACGKPYRNSLLNNLLKTKDVRNIVADARCCVTPYYGSRYAKDEEKKGRVEFRIFGGTLDAEQWGAYIGYGRLFLRLAENLGDYLTQVKYEVIDSREEARNAFKT